MDPDELDRHLDTVLVGGRIPARVELAEHDPAWATQFAEHRERIERALGDLASDVEHIGSTAVLGLAAKPIVDVQLVAGDLDAAVTLLEAAGYVLRVREPGHRMVKAAPPLPAANVHLHEPGDPALTARLRLRDLMRADPVARQRYEDVKRSLAGREWPDVNHYAEAKGPVIRALLDAEPVVACSLEAHDLGVRLADWQRLLSGVVGIDRPEGPEVVLRLGTDVPLGELAALCADEVACCPFFVFSLTVAATGSHLRVTVPADAAPVLDALVALVPPGLG